VPGRWTWLGGLVLMTGLVTVVIASENVSLAEANNQSDKA
jgi:hypothetical protein